MKKVNKTYNSKIEIKERVINIIGGREDESLSPFFGCWCNPKELYGKELYEAMNSKFEECLNFEVRYCTKINEMRLPNAEGDKRRFVVIFNQVQYEVYYLDFMNENKTDVLIKSKRIA